MIAVTEMKGSITLTKEMIQYLVEGKILTYHVTMNGIDFAIDLQKQQDK